MKAARLAALAAAALACAPRLGGGYGPRVETLSAGGARFQLQYWPEDAAAAARVRAALPRAAAAATRWGELRERVTIIIHPTHAALEEAIRREGYPWLRAWARYATIDLQSPRSWSLFGPSDAEVQELVAHELTHCAMYQAAATEWTWPHRDIPLWFREGMASVAAGQGYRRAPLEAIWRYYQENAPGGGDGRPGAAGPAIPGAGDPVSNPEPLYQGESEVVYGAAHWAFDFLVRRYGEERVRALVGRMGRGERFPEAFRAAIGITDVEFERDFRRYVAWHGWR